MDSDTVSEWLDVSGDGGVLKQVRLDSQTWPNRVSLGHSRVSGLDRPSRDICRYRGAWSYGTVGAAPDRFSQYLFTRDDRRPSFISLQVDSGRVICGNSPRELLLSPSS